jgi:Kef-type K+ transport system membrane component KefB
MQSDTIVFSMFLVFSGAAILATLVLYTRQSLLVAYMLLGMLLGPSGLKLVGNHDIVKEIGDIGIIFLLFLLGLHLHPQDLWHMFRKVTIVAVVSSLVFGALGFAVGLAFGFTFAEALIIGAAMMFSSTIIGLKLLPTTMLHHQHIGEVMISVLLMQDILAIIVLLLIHGASNSTLNFAGIGLLAITLPSLIGFAYVVERFVIAKLLARFDLVQEYVFLVAIGWCLGMAELAHLMGLSEEIGAFIGGVAIAAGPIALFIAESLKPLRDFFLVMFFFSIGASFALQYLPAVIIPALILASIALLIKPWLFSVLLQRNGESKSAAWEVGVRLGQSSEFSLLVAYLAASTAPALIGDRANYLIQAMTILTFMVSSYLVVLRYPTPIALSERMRRD